MANVNFFSPDGGTTRYPIEDTEARSRIAGQQNQLNAQGVLGAKNLLEIIASTTTLNGITFTINADKSVTVNGTATANTNFRLIPYANIDLDLWTGKPLRLSGCPSGGSNPTYAMEIYYRDEQEHWIRDFGDGVEVNIPVSGITDVNPNIMVKNGVTVNNLVFKPMLRLASDPDDTYQPYAMTNRELTEKVFEKRALTSADDLNNIKETGVYGISTAPVNSPNNLTYSTLIVQANDANNLRQIIYSSGNDWGSIYVRSFRGNPADWTSWYKFTGTVVS